MGLQNFESFCVKECQCEYNWSCDSAPCRSVCDLFPNTINPTGMSVLFWQYQPRAGIHESPVCTSPYLLLAGWLSTSPVNTLYPSAKFFSFITLGSVNKLIIMSFVSKAGTITSELSCHLTVPLIGWSAMELNVFCVEVSSDLLHLNLANLPKLGEEMYCLNRWHISSYRSKLALCFIRRSLNGPEGCPNNLPQPSWRLAELFFWSDLSWLQADLWANSYVIFTRFSLLGTPTLCTRYRLVWATKMLLAAIGLVFPVLILGYKSFNCSIYHVPVPMLIEKFVWIYFKQLFTVTGSIIFWQTNSRSLQSISYQFLRTF